MFYNLGLLVENILIFFFCFRSEMIRVDESDPVGGKYHLFVVYCLEEENIKNITPSIIIFS